MDLWCEREVGWSRFTLHTGEESKASKHWEQVALMVMGDGQWRGDAFGEVRLDG